jgi:hypothetical protein
MRSMVDRLEVSTEGDERTVELVIQLDGRQETMT